MNEPTKAQRIQQTLQETRERRKTQTCHTRCLKVDRSGLSAKSQEALKRLFAEARWFYNAVLGSEAVFSFDTTAKQVQVKVREVFEPRDLTRLSSQMKQGLLSRIHTSIRTLSALKKQGKKVGRLKFKSRVSSIPLKQHGKTYKVVDPSHIKIQNLPEPLRVHGIEQLDDLELANAHLVEDAGDYYLYVTGCRDKNAETEKPCSAAGIDFNIQAGCQIVLDCEVAIGFDVPISPAVKKHQKKLARQDRTNKKQGRSKHTKNRKKTHDKLKKAHRKANHIKAEIRNKVIHALKSIFAILCTQDDNFRGWQRLWGRRVLQTALAGIMQQLKRLPTTRLVDRYEATTSLCSQCHCRVEPLPLGQEEFVCSNPECGFRCNRHVNAARCMISHSGLEQAGAPVERQIAARLLCERLANLSHVRVSLLR
jgi:putative transposase